MRSDTLKRGGGKPKTVEQHHFCAAGTAVAISSVMKRIISAFKILTILKRKGVAHLRKADERKSRKNHHQRKQKAEKSFHKAGLLSSI